MPGQPWFLDLGAVRADLRPALIRAEQALADKTVATRPCLIPVRRPKPDAPLLLQGPDGLVFVAPDAAIVNWARRHGPPLDTARSFVLTQAILQAVRGQRLRRQT